MFSPGSSASRPSFTLKRDRTWSSRGRPEHGHLPAPVKNSKDEDRARDVIDISLATANVPRFAIKGGKKHHPYDPSVAPYPFNYDAKTVDLDVLDHVYLTQLRNNVSWVDFKDRPPKCSLDLGCGTGAWILDAAKQWKDCHFVGFDLVRIQPRLDILPGLASRIRWVHGNFLTAKLPFEDNSFDHVHMYRVAWGIPETHWDGLFEEIVRVLRPGGAIEIAEEDILFPALPRSYTIRAKQPRPSAPYPRPSLTLSPPPSPLDDSTDDGTDTLPHAHALLESLYFGAFESRMVNLRPTAIIPHHLNIHFRHVHATLRREMPLPPPPVSRQHLRHVPSDCTTRPPRRPSDESTSSLSTMSSQQQQQTPPTTNSSVASLFSDSGPPPPSYSKRTPTPLALSVAPINNSPGSQVLPLPPIVLDPNDRSLALHLSNVYHRILAAREAMWDELVRRIRMRRAGGPDTLHGLGWDDDASDSDRVPNPHVVAPGEARELARAQTRFGDLVAQFERDLRYRTALADALEAGLGWRKPPAERLSKHERVREAMLERAIAEAAKAEAEGAEQATCSRSLKAFVGFKEARE